MAVLVPLGIGLLCGGVITGTFGLRLILSRLDGFVYEHTCTQVTRVLAELKYLRSGQIREALDLLEWELDCGVLEAAAYAQLPTLDRIGRLKLAHVLRTACAYRTEHPHTSSVPGVDFAVAQAFGGMQGAEHGR